MFCKKCGKEIASDSVYCKYCGAQQDIEDNQMSKPANHESRPDNYSHKRVNYSIISKYWSKYNKVLLYSLLALIFLTVAICVFKFFVQSKIADVSIDKVSKELAEACKRYDEIDNFHCGLAKVRKSNKYGFIDKKGKEIIPCKFDIDDASYFENDYCVVTKNELEGVINRHGKIVIPIKYEYISINSDTTFSARLNERSGVLNSKGKIIIPFEYDYCDHYTGGFYVVRVNTPNGSKFGLIEKHTGQLLNSKYYNSVGEFNDGLCPVTEDGFEYFYIDKTGATILSNKDIDGYKLDGGAFSEGLASASKDDYRYLDRNGLPKHEFVFIDTLGNIVSNPIIGNYDSMHSQYGYYSIQGRGFDGFRLGLLNKEGWVVPLRHLLFISYSDESIKDDVVFVETWEKKWGAISISSKQFIIDIGQYDIFPMSYTYGLFLISENGKHGWMNINQEIVIPCIYDGVLDFGFPFSEGFAVVEKDGVLGYVDRYGNDTFSISN